MTEVFLRLPRTVERHVLKKSDANQWNWVVEGHTSYQTQHSKSIDLVRGVSPNVVKVVTQIH